MCLPNSLYLNLQPFLSAPGISIAYTFPQAPGLPGVLSGSLSALLSPMEPGVMPNGSQILALDFVFQPAVQGLRFPNDSKLRF